MTRTGTFDAVSGYGTTVIFVAADAGTAVETETEPAPPSTDQPRVAHLVLKPDWPIALCGANVKERFGVSAPAMDRCTDCLRIASQRRLGYPAWK